MKNHLLITGGAVAAIIIGAWLRWAVAPVMAGYRIGRQMGRMTARRP